MASTTLYGALKGWLQGQFAPTRVLDFDQIDTVLEQGTDTFLMLEELFADERLISFGDPSSVCVREAADLMVHVFVPAPESSSAARTFADNVRDLLSHQVIAGVRVLTASPPNLDLLNDGLWSTATIDVEAEYDRHVSLP